MSKKRFSITAIIYDKRGRVISVGQNSYVKTHPLQAKFSRQVGEPEKVFLHAEIAAIAKCLDITKADKIVVTRFTEDGKPANAKPCAACAAAIKSFGINKIVHT